jgi:TRAP-type C4-dicarboxylate transport system substrate-binding protein
MLAAGCGGSGGDKSGGTQDAKPLVLRLESEDDLTLTGAPEFGAAVEKLSGGAMRIEFVPAQRGTEVNFEKGVVSDVRSGKAQLGIVAVRVWDTIGVTSFRALLAPLLVDSYELERRVIESPAAVRMLEGVERGGVVGIALLPGPLRRPLGLSNALLALDDYRGMTVGIRPAGVGEDALRALGATPKGYVPGDLSGLDGVETDPKTVDYNGWRGVLTSNVVLWPKPYSIVMNRQAYEALTSEQRDVLSHAGRAALAPELGQTISDAAASLDAACRRGLLSLAIASPAELTALRRAVRRVYDELERDTQTRDLLDTIAEMRASTPATTLPPRCGTAGPGGATATATPLDGRWTYTWTRPELLAAGIAEKYIPRGVQRATVIAEFRRGRYTLSAAGKVRISGTYSVEGNVMSLVHKAPARGYVAGQVYRQRFSVYRDKLVFRRFAGSDYDLVLLVKPFTRVL